ncbi:MAG: ATP-binding protein [Nannocystis sp.]|nr:ATP-binding protein [Nannocystis sp.]
MTAPLHAAHPHRKGPLLTRIFIDNYRTFEGFTWRPERVAIVMGRNGSGKSSLFDLLYALCALVSGDGTVVTCFPAGSRSRWSTRPEQILELEVEIPAGTFIYRLEIVHGQESHIGREVLRTATETLFEFEDGVVRLHDDVGNKKVEFKANSKQSGLGLVVADASNTRLTAFKQWLAGVLVVRPNPATMDGRAPIENPRLVRDLANFASWYRYAQLKQPNDIAGAVAAFAEIVPRFRSMSMPVDEQRVGWLRAHFDGPDGNPYTLRFEELSDGQRVLFALYTILHTEGRGARTVALDEPDNFVALEEIQPFLFELLDRALADEGSQILIASHHPEYLDQLAPAYGWVVDRPSGGASVVGRFKADVAISTSALVARGGLSADRGDGAGA